MVLALNIYGVNLVMDNTTFAELNSVINDGTTHKAIRQSREAYANRALRLYSLYNANKGEIIAEYLKHFPKHNIDTARPQDWTDHAEALMIQSGMYLWLYKENEIAGRPVTTMQLIARIMEAES